MSFSKERRFTRNKRGGGQMERELRSTDTNSQASPSTPKRGRSTRSPARVERLPLKEVNKETTRGNTSIPSQVSVTKPIILHNQPPSELLDNTSPVITCIMQNKDTGDELQERGTPPQVGDNRALSLDTSTEVPRTAGDLPTQFSRAKEDPGGAILLVLQELQEIRKQMTSLNKMENTTASLVEQLAATTSRTVELESKVQKTEAGVLKLNGNMATLQKDLLKQDTKQGEIETKLKKLDDNFGPLNTLVQQQQGRLTELETLKKGITTVTAQSQQNIKQMNELIDTQREQVDSFNKGAKQLEKDWKKEVMAEVEKRFNKMANEKHCDELKDQAYRNRYNLVLLGLKEEEAKTTMQVIKDFFNDILKIKHLDIHSAERLGSQTDAGDSYARPIVVRFNRLPHRNRVWRKRKEIPTSGPNSKVRIHADLPKDLREGIQTLYRIATAASKMESLGGIKVQDYQLIVNGVTYQITDLESLPEQLRPSTLATKKSDTHLVFFSKHTAFSNHFPSQFTLDNQQFGSMEHFLAFKRAELSGKEDLIQRAKNVKDPVQAKHILNILHNDQQERWTANVEELVMEGLRAKFLQNPHLCEYLTRTGNLTLGEASTNPRWGIGMDLNNPEVLNDTKWLEAGNLLGRSLMNLRKELLQGREPKRLSKHPRKVEGRNNNSSKNTSRNLNTEGSTNK